MIVSTLCFFCAIDYGLKLCTIDLFNWLIVVEVHCVVYSHFNSVMSDKFRKVERLLFYCGVYDEPA